MGLDLHEKPIKGDDVDNQPTLIIKLPQAYEYAQLLAKSAMEHFIWTSNEHAIFNE